MKKVLAIHKAPHKHWVGDGFPVRSLFSYNDHGKDLSPFLLLDYAEATEFSPTSQPRGVGQHPHRGFETVTIVYHGEVAHRDSTGSGGLIGPGDVQWMTAAGGIIHEEFHSKSFSESGGTLEMVQLWVNLPAANKMSHPRYQTLLSADIPHVELPGQAGKLRVIAGQYQTFEGPAQTFTPLNVWDLSLNAGKRIDLQFEPGHTLAVVVLQGELIINDHRLSACQLAILDSEHRDLVLQAQDDSKVLLLSGQPLDEPMVGYGPFVMNQPIEIEQAIEDFNQGRFGRISAS